MADLLPSFPDTSAAEEAEPRVIGVDSDDADETLAALSSATARRILIELHEEPAPPAQLADRVGTSLQNAQYHLEKLEDAGLIEVLDTAYSEKGREMDVFAPTDRPLVIFAGGEEQATGLRSALSRLLGALGVLAFASIAIQEVFGRRGITGLVGAPTAGADGGEGGEGAAADRAAGGGDGGAAAPGAGGDGGAAGTPTEAGARVADVANATKQPATPTRAPAATPVPEAETPHPTAAPTPTPAPEPTATPAPEPTGTPVATATDVTETALRAARETAAPGADGAAGLPPGLMFFAGGAAVLLVTFALLYLRRG